MASRSALSQITLPGVPTASGHASSKAYVDQSMRTVDSLASITSPVTGQLALLTTDLMIYRWTGSAWLGIMHTAVNGGHAKYTRTSGQANAIGAAVWVRQAFNIAIDTTPDVTPLADWFDMFTLNRTGLWEIDASTRAGTTNVASVRYQYGIFPYATPGTGAYKVITNNEPAANANSTNLSVAVRRRFTSGTQICVAVRRDGNGGGGGDNAASEASATEEGWCQLSLRWAGP